MEYVPPLAPLVVLAFLGTAFLLAVLGAAFLAAALAKKRRIMFSILVGGACVLLIYGSILLAFSTFSKERTLQLGEKKYFCEIDCHLAYSVTSVEVARVLGSPPREARATGTYRVVTLRTWFDESTISPRRGREYPLSPNPRAIYVEDAAGRRYERSQAAEDALTAMGRTSTPVTRSLRPGEAYDTILVFDIPDDARGPRLFVGCPPGVEFALIGHEMSPLHKKIWFSVN